MSWTSKGKITLRGIQKGISNSGHFAWVLLVHWHKLSKPLSPQNYQHAVLDIKKLRTLTLPHLTQIQRNKISTPPPYSTPLKNTHTPPSAIFAPPSTKPHHALRTPTTTSTPTLRNTPPRKAKSKASKIAKPNPMSYNIDHQKAKNFYSAYADVLYNPDFGIAGLFNSHPDGLPLRNSNSKKDYINLPTNATFVWLLASSLLNHISIACSSNPNNPKVKVTTGRLIFVYLQVLQYTTERVTNASHQAASDSAKQIFLPSSKNFRSKYASKFPTPYPFHLGK